MGIQRTDSFTSGGRNPFAVHILVYILGMCVQCALATPGETRAYCEDQTFQGRCEDDEVIIMEEAKYGRMRLGSCLQRDYGNMGCDSDVIYLFDQWCSGRPTCDVDIKDMIDEKDIPVPCPKDLRSYLEARYRCVKVAMPTVQRCQNPPMITDRSGFISSYVTHETRCGDLDSPWILRMPQGQRVNLTLYDFGAGRGGGGGMKYEVPICQVLAVIKESARGISETVCSGSSRIENVYLSTSSEVEVRFVLKAKPQTTRYFMLEYNAVGCPDLEASGSFVFRRSRAGADVGCAGDDELHPITCQHNDWVGKIPVCEKGDPPVSSNMVMGTMSSLPSGLAVAIILAIALLIGAVILTVGLVYIRRRRALQRSHDQLGMRKDGPKAEYYSTRGAYTDAANVTSGIPGSDDPTMYTSYNGENNYYRTWELQRHLSPVAGGHVAAGTGIPGGGMVGPAPHVTMHSARACAAASIPPYHNRSREPSPPRYVDHIYESPKSVRREITGIGGGAESLKYFELDPSDQDKKPSSDPVL